VETPSSPVPNPSADWLEGYEAAIGDAVAMIDLLWAPGIGSLSSPVLIRLRTRLIQLGAESTKKVA